MPALANVANVIRLVFSGTFQDAKFKYILHLRYAGAAPSSSDLNALAGSAAASFAATGPHHYMSALALITSAEATDLTTSVSATGSWSGSVGGSDAGDNAAANLAVGVSWRVARRYRGGHSRTYLCGVTDTMFGSRTTWTATLRTNVGAGANAWLAAVLAATWGGFGAGALHPCVVHYRLGNVILAVPLVDDITAAVIHPRIDTQRRRLGREVI